MISKKLLCASQNMKLIDDKKSAIKFVNTLARNSKPTPFVLPLLLTTTKQTFAIKCVR